MNDTISQLTEFNTDNTRKVVHEWLLENNNRFIGIEKLNKELFNFIITNYDACPTTKRPNGEIFFNYMNDQNIPICPSCQMAPIKFITYHRGYAQYCGAVCAASSSVFKRMGTMRERYGDNSYSHPDITRKRSNTNLTKYGHANYCQSTEGKEKTKETILKKYGVDHYSKTAEFKEKFTSTMEDRHGVKYAMQSAELNHRHEDSLEKNHGVRHPSQSPEIYKNRNNAMKAKYGVEHAMQSVRLTKKHQETLQRNYGVDYPIQNEEIRDRMKSTMMDRYGKEFSAQVDYIFEKVKQTNLNRYGVEFPLQNDYIFEKVKQTNLDRYGVEFPMQNEAIRQQTREKMESEGKWIPLDLLSEAESYYKHVIKYTNHQSLTQLEHFDERGLAGVTGAYHVDHKVSIKYGFINSIPPCIIGSIDNLEMLPWRDNVYKSDNCSINPGTLIDTFYVTVAPSITTIFQAVPSLRTIVLPPAASVASA